MSLRRRVLLGTLSVALVLLVADLVLAGTFRSHLLDRVDQQLAEVATPFVRFAGSPEARGRRGGPRLPPSEFHVAVHDDDGRLLGRLGAPVRPDRKFPDADAVQVRTAATAPGEPVAPFTAGGSGDGGWRLVAIELPAGDEILVVGSSLATVWPTYERMIAVLVVATVAVFATLALVAWWVLRLGVRPLAAMTATAEAIAGNTLDTRVPEADERTEAGRLAIALNTMLARLQSAFAQREESEQRLRRFVADASHELRTPLTSIRGYADLYRAGGLEEPDRLDDAMRRIAGESRRMGVLVDDLLLLARLDQGRPVQRQHVAFGDIVTDAVADLAAVQPDRHIEVDITPVTVLGDDAHLRQAISNLLANVRVHTPVHAPARVRVGSDGAEAVVEVADEGPGMSPEVARRVFERFFRADAARARATGGSGLGLAIVAGVVEAHGGSVDVVSEPGRGTRFILRLPLAPAADRAPSVGTRAL